MICACSQIQWNRYCWIPRNKCNHVSFLDIHVGLDKIAIVFYPASQIQVLSPLCFSFFPRASRVGATYPPPPPHFVSIPILDAIALCLQSSPFIIPTPTGLLTAWFPAIHSRGEREDGKFEMGLEEGLKPETHWLQGVITELCLSLSVARNASIMIYMPFYFRFTKIDNERVRFPVTLGMKIR